MQATGPGPIATHHSARKNLQSAIKNLQSHLPLALILLAALLWRLLLWAQPLHQPANDEIEYVQVARDLLAGRGWSFYERWSWMRAPLYTLWLAGSLWLAGGDLHRAALPNLALSLVLILLIYRIARELSPGSRRPALIAAAIAATLQTYATFASLYMSEILFSTLFSAGLLSLAAWQRRGGLWRAALAGLLFGLACLTRSAALIFLPVAALWLTWLGMRRAGRLHLSTLLPGLLLALAAAAVIAPWTLRNCRAYGECVLIETGGAYNLWTFYEPRESLDEIHQTLEAIPNPVDRADEARRRGLARLREDPLILARKLPSEWTRLWAVKPIQDRFLMASAYSDPPPALFISALLLDDLLYLLILCAAPFGLALALRRRDAFALLLALWMAAFIAASMLTHNEGRYRHFLFMALIPLAGLALDALARRERWGRAPMWAAATGLALALLPALVFYPWDWAGRGALRSLHRVAGDRHAAAGRYEAAAQSYRAAIEVDRTPDGLIALGDLARRAGDPAAAERYYLLAHAERPPYVGASAAHGDLLRELGRADAARAAFRGSFLRPQYMIDWSYAMLRPTPRADLDVGDGLDFGYIGGVYPGEQIQGADARWTNGRGELRLGTPEAPATTQLLALRVAAPRPDGAAVPLSVCRARRCASVPIGAEWRVVRMLVPGGDGPISLRSPTFAAPDRRDLGVLLDHAAVTAP